MSVALVTGAYKGLGLAWCARLAAEGHDVILTARSKTKAEAAAATLGSSRVHPRALDVTDETALAALAAWTGERFGRLDLLVNNAGVNPKDFPDPARKAAAFRLDALDAGVMGEVLRVNSLAPLLAVKHFRPWLRRAERPLVLSVSSWLGSVSKLSFGGHYGYVGSKNLLNVLHRSMAFELRDEGIICVTVNPGWVRTDMGGSRAELSPEAAVDRLMAGVVRRVTLADTGRFLDHDGTDHPW